ncbi:MAG TPA: TonB family protein [Vicinamibacteria bacterium]|nr:TonB family protein [Vicinamibacteria bacterium]
MEALVALLLYQPPEDLALLEAAAAGDEKVVENSIDNGGAVEVRDEDGRTPLILAAAGGHLSVVRTLLSAGAKTNARAADGWTALAHAEAEGHTKVVDLLVDKGAKWRDVPFDELGRDMKELAEAWDTDPVPQLRPATDYPTRARERDISGEVVMKIKVLIDGSTEVLQVVKPLLYCTDAAKESARQWRWKPAEKDGKPVEATGIITVTFDIR